MIKYDYTQDKRWIQISVTDTGKGIPADKQAQVFERFNKLDEFAQGTGLGLAICQIIIEHFGGYISEFREVVLGNTKEKRRVYEGISAAKAGLSPF